MMRSYDDYYMDSITTGYTILEKIEKNNKIQELSTSKRIVICFKKQFWFLQKEKIIPI